MIFSEAGVPAGSWLFPLITLGVLLALLLTLFVFSYLNHHTYRDVIEDELKKSESQST